MKIISSNIIVFTLIIFSFTSCKKETGIEKLQPDEVSNKSIEINSSITKPEVKVDQKLLDDYIDYKLENEKADFLKKAGVKYSSPVKPISDVEYYKMIDNYLLNEANTMVEKYAWSKNLKSFDIIPNNPTPPGDTTEAQCEGVGTITLVVMQAIRNAQLNISYQSFSFSGLTGSMSPSGMLIQSVSNGVTTYRRNYTETITFQGVTYTQLYTLYGNIYNGQATVNMMRRTPN